VIQLRRFDFDKRQGQRVKIDGQFAFPLEFDFRAAFDEDEDAQALPYVLARVGVHSGMAYGSHYFSFVRRERWWKLDDEKVAEVPEDEVVSACHEKGSVSGYILF
jgi:ubiquitin C-terminal hydrolase